LRAGNDLGNSGAIREQVARDEYGISSLCANFVIAESAMPSGQSPPSRRPRHGDATVVESE
jgi:hypothetical protein